MRSMSENICSSKSPQVTLEKQNVHGDGSKDEAERLAENALKQNQWEKIQSTSAKCAEDRKTNEIGVTP